MPHRWIRTPVLLLSLVLARPLLAEEVSVVSEPPITADDREHWSFRPLQRPAVPSAGARTAENTIDLFCNGADTSGLSDSAAHRAALLRRLTLDLWGLPPSPTENARFLADANPDAYERLVDRTLASPRYGERDAQHWLDLARFAETDGFEHDKVRSEAWRFRDWVIDAANQGMAYDRFVQLQIAGDELAPEDPQARVATAFCLSGPDMPDINSQAERRHSLLNEMTATVGSVFLGLQVGCAQCHDHKYDPISQADFYRLRAFFVSAVQVKKNRSVSTLSSGPPETAYLMIRGAWDRPGPAVSPAFPRIADWQSHPTAAQRSRSELARWLTAPQNPLTARVLANRLWQQHFGSGLSSTPSDFGLVGVEPAKLDLLNWIASETHTRDWNLKQMHRLLVTSAHYRYHFTQSIRLEGEVIRDAMLACAGLLNTRQGGPGVMPPLPREITSTLLKNQWATHSDRAAHYRRSVYVFARRNLRYPIFDAFDRPDANVSCACRARSTTAPQSLLLLNSEFSWAMAEAFAARVQREAGSEPRRALTTAFQLALNRAPTSHELADALAFLADGGSLNEFCLALMNLNEFVYVDIAR